MAGTERLVKIESSMNGAKYKEILDENLLQSTQDLRLGSMSNRTTTLSTQPRQRKCGFRTIALQQRSPSNLTERIERFASTKY